MIAAELEQQDVVGAPRVHGPVHLRIGIGSKMADSPEGRARIAAALRRYAAYNGTPFPCHGGTVAELDVEVDEPVGAASGSES